MRPEQELWEYRLRTDFHLMCSVREKYPVLEKAEFVKIWMRTLQEMEEEMHKYRQTTEL